MQLSIALTCIFGVKFQISNFLDIALSSPFTKQKKKSIAACFFPGSFTLATGFGFLRPPTLIPTSIKFTFDNNFSLRFQSFARRYRSKCLCWCSHAFCIALPHGQKLEIHCWTAATTTTKKQFKFERFSSERAQKKVDFLLIATAHTIQAKISPEKTCSFFHIFFHDPFSLHT